MDGERSECVILSRYLLFDYYPLPLATKHLGCEEIELLVLAHAGMITLYQYPDPANLIEWEQVNIMEIGAAILENTKTGKKYRADLANFDTQRSDLVLPRVILMMD
ncbi:hypothetical protein [Kosakonia oryziphila]|uniref:Uncharacterized protein n=1 Tax=Kosakonia oryziphila TaxID=1005667 RepID=A0A1C3ZQR6_9ENTR|nr:hypothetical protein [Kosakonia oryziphila]SCB84641.1 hypothetical protein GA0061070_1002109 [Kosakonia oryziphila]